MGTGMLDFLVYFDFVATRSVMWLESSLSVASIRQVYTY
jgi:hypothetical protein